MVVDSTPFSFLAVTYRPTGSDLVDFVCAFSCRGTGNRACPQLALKQIFVAKWTVADAAV